MPRKKEMIPEYKSVMYNGNTYYRTRIKDADGRRVAIYGLTREELHEKVKNTWHCGICDRSCVIWIFQI